MSTIIKNSTNTGNVGSNTGGTTKISHRGEQLTLKDLNDLALICKKRETSLNRIIYSNKTAFNTTLTAQSKEQCENDRTNVRRLMKKLTEIGESIQSEIAQRYEERTKNHALTPKNINGSIKMIPAPKAAKSHGDEFEHAKDIIKNRNKS